MKKEELENWIREYSAVSFARSGGPGGQYVNTSDTKVVLRLPIALLPVTDEERTALLSTLKNRLNSKGELVIHASASRSQFQNRKAAENLAEELIAAALMPETKRRPTRPTKASRQHRLDTKKANSRKKELRRKPDL